MRVEVGPRDVQQGACVMARRDRPGKEGKMFGVPMEAGAFVAAVQVLSGGAADLSDPEYALSGAHCRLSFGSSTSLAQGACPRSTSSAMKMPGLWQIDPQAIRVVTMFETVRRSMQQSVCPQEQSTPHLPRRVGGIPSRRRCWTRCNSRCCRRLRRSGTPTSSTCRATRSCRRQSATASGREAPGQVRPPPPCAFYSDPASDVACQRSLGRQLGLEHSGNDRNAMHADS